MGNHKIKMNIGIYDEMDNLSEIISVDTEGMISESESISIDAVERAFLKANKELLKKSIPAYLGEVSKKKPKTSKVSMEEK